MKTDKSIKTEPKRVCFSYARVSSILQTTDDKTGIERQLETARRVAKEKGWALDETLSIADLGVSGYTGKNLGDTAKLGILLKALKDGKIPASRIMVLEALDRLTRLEIDEAYDQLRDILRAGLEIYIDRGSRHYTKASLKNPIDLIIAIVELAASHEYSAKLGERLSKAWKIKKQRAVEDGKPYRYKCASWLNWNEEKKCYEADPVKVQSVKRAFELATMGMGVRGVAKRMNEEKVPVISKYRGRKVQSARGWSCATIAKLLKRKYVLGINDNLQPPIKMFPQIISDKLYYTAQAKIEARKTHKFYGFSSDKPQNLFAGLSKCSKCGDAMNIFHNKAVITENTGSRGGQVHYAYLKCTGVRNGTCSRSQLQHRKIEESFAMMLSGSNFVNAYGETRPEQGNILETLKGKIADTENRLKRYTKDYENSPSDMLANLMTKTEIKEKALRQELEQTTAIKVGTNPLQDIRNEFLNILYKGWYDIDVRLKLRELIRAVVEKMVINGPDRCYTLFWKNKAKPTQVEIFRKAYKIDKILIPAVPNWEKEMVRAGEVIRKLEAEKAEQVPEGLFRKLTGRQPKVMAE